MERKVQSDPGEKRQTDMDCERPFLPRDQTHLHHHVPFTEHTPGEKQIRSDSNPDRSEALMAESDHLHGNNTSASTLVNTNVRSFMFKYIFSGKMISNQLLKFPLVRL